MFSVVGDCVAATIWEICPMTSSADFKLVLADLLEDAFEDFPDSSTKLLAVCYECSTKDYDGLTLISFLSSLDSENGEGLGLTDGASHPC